MISYALIANGQHNPYLATPLPEHMLYPISQNCDMGIDLDYSALILGERFIIDSAVYEDVMSSRKEYFAPIKHSFTELSACGLLEKEDYSVFFTENRDKIVAITNLLLENVGYWLHLEQIQWSSLKPELVDFQNMYGSKQMYIPNTTNIGIESWLARTDQVHNNQLRDNLYLLFEGKKSIEEVGEENVRGALQFIVAQIVMSDLISHIVKSPILDWDDSKGMYDRLYALQWTSYEKESILQQETNKLFKIVAPDLKPNNITQVVKFICDNKAVTSLRSTLLELISAGETVNPEWMTKYINEVMRAELALQRKSSVFQFFGTIAGLIPGPWFQGAAVSGATTITDKLLFRRDNKYEWYYALQKKT